jgi:hypothetical protein
MQAPGTALRLGQARRAHPDTELADMATGLIVAIDPGKFKSVVKGEPGEGPGGRSA